MVLAYIVSFSLLGSIGSIMLAGSFLLFPEKTRRHLIPLLVSYATGTLLGASLLGLLPHTLEQLSAQQALLAVLIGIVLFFVLEKYVLWRHCHDTDCAVHTTGVLILIGDAFHNFLDGVVIATTFVNSIPLGIATSLAVISHEVPQELGDFAILLDSGYSRSRALFFNALSGASALVGAFLTYFFVLEIRGLSPYIMALSAASFIYIATADLVPNLHRETDLKRGMLQLAGMVAGIVTISLFHLD